MGISSRHSLVEKMTREEIEKRMDELAPNYVETHDKEIIEELYKLALELEKYREGVRPFHRLTNTLASPSLPIP